VHRVPKCLGDSGILAHSADRPAGRGFGDFRKEWEVYGDSLAHQDSRTFRGFVRFGGHGNKDGSGKREDGIKNEDERFPC
jgi:hypothetical protein